MQRKLGAIETITDPAGRPGWWGNREKMPLPCDVTKEVSSFQEEQEVITLCLYLFSAQIALKLTLWRSAVELCHVIQFISPSIGHK